MIAAGPPPTTAIDGWKVVKELGDGGFAVVYLVEKDGKLYALKLARHREASGDDKQTHARTLREVAILLTMDHPNILKPRGFGYLPDGRVYLVLDYVDGWTLGEWVERKHPTAHEILRVFVKIATALAYMHARGVLHRDLKLINILIRKSDGEPVIIDFSCATHTRAEDLTDGGLPPGTDRYRAPEAFRFLREHKDEHRARYAFQVADEIFAVGAMLYELLTDPRPMEDRPRPVLNSAIRPPTPAKELNPRVPEALSDLVDSLLSRDPARRPVDTEAMQRELAELLADLSAEYMAPVHPPSEQRPENPVETASGNERPEKGPVKIWWGLRKKLVVGGAVGAVVLMTAITTYARLGRGFRDPSSEGAKQAMSQPERVVATAPPSQSPGPMGHESPPPASVPAGTSATETDPSPTVTASIQKEGSNVKTLEPETTKQARTPHGQKSPLSPTMCKALSFLAAVAAGCTGVPVRPDPFECPERAQTVMLDQQRWFDGYRFALGLDDRFDRDSRGVFRLGAEVVGLVPQTGLDSEQRKMGPPPGTRFWGRVYVDPQDQGAKDTGQPAALLVKYERMKLPGQEEVPVCIIGRSVHVYSMDKDGTTSARNSGEGKVVTSYP
jgi:serine/threonine protein kinase